MEEKGFIVSILTKDCNNDDRYFNGTVNSLVENTNFPDKPYIHVYHDGTYKTPIIDSINNFVLAEDNKVAFSFRVSNGYNGVKHSVDLANEWVGEYKYCLFMPGEWVTIPENKNWLIDSLKFMDENNIDQLLLYPYENKDNIEKEENEFAFLKEFKYTNKPHIRRNKSFFDNNVFPLQEYNNESKPLKSAWLKSETMITCDDFLSRINDSDDFD